MPDGKVYIIGVASEGAASLSAEATRLLQRADMVIGGVRLIDMFPDLQAERVVIGNNLGEVADLIKKNINSKRIVVLASGDPNFYGIARYLIGKLGKDIFEIIPNVSAMQLAFARIRENWDDAATASVHSRPIEDIVSIVSSNRKIGIFTDDKHSPGEIARVLREHGVANCRAYVCQELGSDKESVIDADLYSLPDMEFLPLNILILVRDDKSSGRAGIKPYFGIPDHEFKRRQEGLITKLEVRAVSLTRLCLKEDSVIWDIGSGSGAVSIEAAFLARRGSVFAIEKDARSVNDVRENTRKFGAENVSIIQVMAPEGLGELLNPDAVFVGGSGGNLTEILEVACRCLKPGGKIVVNAATLETLLTALDSLKANGFTTEVTSVNIARSQEIARLTRFESLNPVFVITGWREREQQGE